eukprot:m.18968 g.18968  ORF g.18968 m.18968 type:complete len:490 (-) comp5041_c0_seq1:186-1655(-)
MLLATSISVLRAAPSLLATGSCYGHVSSLVRNCGLTSLTVNQGRATSSFVAFLKERDMIQDVTSEALQTSAQTHTVYCGFDPTARSLHVGNLLAIMGLVHCHVVGHNTIALIGGATGRIGDPSGRSSERSLLPMETVNENVEGISKVLNRIFSNAQEIILEQVPGRVSHPQKNNPTFTIVNNNDWYAGRSVIEFFAEIGRHFRVGSMLAKESVKSRLVNHDGMSFTEFSYQVFQSFDFLHLNEKYNCDVQIGGSDQWGNITAGIDLIHRVKNKSVFGITMPLFTTASGEKFGKSAGNAVWLDASMTAPYDLYQFFMNVADAEIRKYALALTLLPVSIINKVVEEGLLEPEQRMGQKFLAFQVVRLIHGKNIAEGVELASRVLFGPEEELKQLNSSQLEKLFCAVPIVKIEKEKYWNTPLRDIGAEVGLFSSKKDGRRTTESGGFYVNGKKIATMNECLDTDNDHILGPEGSAFSILRKGKKHVRVLHLV